MAGFWWEERHVVLAHIDSAAVKTAREIKGPGLQLPIRDWIALSQMDLRLYRTAPELIEPRFI